MAKTCESMHIFMRTTPYVLPARDRPLTTDEATYSKEYEEKKARDFVEDPAGEVRTFPRPTKTLAQLLAEEDGEAKVKPMLFR